MEELAELGTNIKSLLEWQVKKDAADKANQEVIDKHLAKSKQLRLDNGEQRQESVSDLIADAFQKNEKDIQAFATKQKTGDFSFQTKAVGDMGTGNITGGTVSQSTVLPGIIENANRRNHISPLLARTPITGNLVYLKENGPGEGSIAAVAENATKNQIDFDMAEVTAQSNYVAGFARVSRKFIAQVPGAVRFLTNRLTEAYMKAEDNLILNGTGVSPEFLGLNVAGNFTAATSLAADNDLDQLVLGVGQLAALDRNPDLIILHPNDLYRMLINKSAGSGEYDTPSVIQISGTNMSVAGVAVATSTAQAVGTYTIADRMGMLIGVAENMNVRFFEEDGTNVRENKVTVRVESSIAMAVFGSSYIVKGSFS